MPRGNSPQLGSGRTPGLLALAPIYIVWPMKTFVRAALATAAMLGVIGCGGSGDTAPTSRLPVDHIAMSASATSVRVGQTVTLTATPVAADGSTIAGSGMTWTSGSKSIATVNASGVVTGVALGVADIAATSGGKSGHTAVTVTPANGGPTGDYVDVSLDRELYTTCGRSATVARCWGHNPDGEVGDGTQTDRAAPTQVGGSVSFAQISAGEPRSCGRTAVGDVYCWGNLNFVAGNSPDYHVTPALVASGLGFVDLSVSTSNICGLDASGKAYCWGGNTTGAVGDGTLNVRPTPVTVSGGLTFAQITVGRDFACGRTTAGVAYCWGKNDLGQLGDSTKTNRLAPTKVSDNLTFASIAAGFSAVCGLTPDGAIYCWGSTIYVVPGTGGVSTVPAHVTSTQSFVQVATGVFHACALTAAGAAWCWGDGIAGELGTGSLKPNSDTPVAVTGGLAFAKISAGKDATCGVTVLGALYCWGSDTFGDLGFGQVGKSANAPTLVP